MKSYKAAIAVVLAAGITMFAAGRMTAEESTPKPAASAKKADRANGARRGGGANIYRVALGLTGLTPDQEKKLKDQQKEFTDKMKSAREDAGVKQGERPDAETMKKLRTKYQSMNDDAKKKIEEVLTDAQKKDFEQKTKDMNSRWRDNQTSKTK
jgi:hypothetical protein